MNTSAKSATTLDADSSATTALALKTVSFDDDMMHVTLTDGRIISVPVAGSPYLPSDSRKRVRKLKLGLVG